MEALQEMTREEFRTIIQILKRQKMKNLNKPVRGQ